MSDYTGVFKPKSYAIRAPLDDKRHHGRVINPPRLAHLGGMDKAKEPNGHYRSAEMSIKKPGDTTSASKK